MRLPATCRYFPTQGKCSTSAGHITAALQSIQASQHITGMPWTGRQLALGLTVTLLAWAHVRADHASTYGNRSLTEERIHGAAFDAPEKYDNGLAYSKAQYPPTISRPSWDPVQSQTNGVSTLYTSQLFECWTR